MAVKEALKGLVGTCPDELTEPAHDLLLIHATQGRLEMNGFPLGFGDKAAVPECSLVWEGCLPEKFEHWRIRHTESGIRPIGKEGKLSFHWSIFLPFMGQINRAFYKRR